MERLLRGHLHLSIQRVLFFNGFEFNQLRRLNVDFPLPLGESLPRTRSGGAG